MMRNFKAAAIGMVFMVPILFFGCAGSSQKKVKPRPTLFHVNYKTDQYIQKAAIVFGGTPGSAVGRQVGELYLQTLIRTIRKKNKRVHLIGEQDKDFPDYLKELTKPSPAHDISRLAELSRAQGYQGLLRIAVLEVQPKAMKTGMLWFRKMHYFLTFGLSLDLYDPFTGAKLLSAIKEETIKIDVDDYEAIRDQNLGSLEDLDEEVVDAAEDLGEQVARTFKSQPWKASVAAVQDGRIFLAVDPQSGLKVGDRLAVFQGRRVIEGPQGEKLIVPGYLVGEIRITGLDDRMAQSAADVQTDIQEGDIAVPVH